MKQHITPEQLDGLSEKAEKKLLEYWIPKEGDWVYERSITKHRDGTITINEGYVDLNSNDAEWGYVVGPGMKQDRCLPLLSIGQMIEFLDEQDDYFKCWYKKGNESKETPSHTKKMIEWEYNEDLCDALWEAVKQELEK